MSRIQPLHGLFLGSRAVAEGFATRRQLQSGLYRRVLRDVYADPSLPADHQLHARAAGLLLPSSAVIGGRSAAAWFGAPFAAAQDPVLVLVPPDASWRGPRGVRVHRTAVAGGEVLGVDDVPITTPLRTAWEIATLEPVPTAVGLLDGMARSGRLDAAVFRTWVEERRGRWGSARAAVVAPLVDARSESPPESWVRVAVLRAGLPAPVPQFDVVHAGDFLGRADLAWPEERVIVEYEGAYHFEGVQIVRDDERYRRFEEAGWTVVRLSAADLRDMGAVVARIAQALRPRP